MAYPEPIPEVTGPAAKKLIERLQKPKASPAHKKLYRNAEAYYNEKKPKK